LKNIVKQIAHEWIYKLSPDHQPEYQNNH